MILRLKSLLNIILIIMISLSYSGCCIIPIPVPIYVNDGNKVYFITEGEVER